MELTPLVPVGRQVIERYGASGFRVAGVTYRGAVLVFPDRTQPWAVASAASVTWESLEPVIGAVTAPLWSGLSFGACHGCCSSVSFCCCC